MSEYEEQLGQGRLSALVDVDSLAEDIGLDETEIAWRKDFLNFDETDAQNLENLADLFEDHADETIDSFYARLGKYGDTRAILARSPKTTEELKRAQKAYLMTLAAGEYGQAYFENRVRIGKLHELLDMPMKQYLAQYTVYYRFLLDLLTDRLHDRLTTTLKEQLVDESTSGGITQGHATLEGDLDRLIQHLDEDVEESLEEGLSLLKLLNLDMQIAVETYLQSRIDDIERERDRFEALFENVPVPVVVVHLSEEGIRLNKANPAFEEVFGYTADELADRDLEEYLTPEDEESHPVEDRGIAGNLSTAPDSELTEAEVTLETQFGRREFIRVSAPFDLPESDDLEYVFYIDVTEQKQRHERLQVLSRVLRHDIRNKMSVVKGSATTLAESVTDEEYEDILGRIRRSSEELLATSEEIRHVERVVADDRESQPINVSATVAEILDDVRERYPECDFSMSEGGETWVSATTTLEFALEEVIENGVIHNDATDPRVEVSVIESLDSQYVNIRVTDNGPGISPAEYEVLTGERKRSQIDHTSGLGLWAVNWIVTRAGGTLDFTANSPRGTIVNLRLPQAESPESGS